MLKKNFYVLFVLLNLSIILFFWSLNSLHLPMALSLGRLSGLLLVFCILNQLLLIGRTGWIESIYGHAKLSQKHRLIGFFSLFFLIFHPFLLTINYSQNANTSLLTQTISFIKYYDDLKGAYLGLLLLIVTIFLSIYIVRKKLKYETWYYVHLSVYLAILFSWGHQLKWGGDFINNIFVTYWYLLYLFTVTNFVYYRFLKQLLKYNTHRFHVQKIIQESPNSFSLYISGLKLEKFHFLPGQFAQLRLLHPKYFLESHPFSFSTNFNGRFLRFTFKQLGDFTNRLPEIPLNTPVLIDGPLGNFTLHPNNLPNLFIAGGVGITPIRSLLEQSCSSSSNNFLIYTNKNPASVIFQKELDNFVCQNKLKIDYTFTNTQARINQSFLSNLIGSNFNQNIYICGPRELITSCTKYLISLGVPQQNIHSESFTL